MLQIVSHARRRKVLAATPRESWAQAFPVAANQLGWTLKKGLLNGKMSVWVPPDDLIQIIRKNTPGSRVRKKRRYLYENLAVIARFDGDWQSRVHVRAREEPGVVLTFSPEPIAVDDPRYPWVVEGRDPRAANALFTSSLVEAVNQIWDPTMWIDVARYKGKTRVVVGTENGEASTQRLERMVALTRELIGAAQQLPRQGIGTEG